MGGTTPGVSPRPGLFPAGTLFTLFNLAKMNPCTWMYHAIPFRMTFFFLC